MESHLRELQRRKELAAETPQEAEAQHKKGKLTARERLGVLFDHHGFEEVARSSCRATLPTPAASARVTATGWFWASG